MSTFRTHVLGEIDALSASVRTFSSARAPSPAQLGELRMRAAKLAAVARDFQARAAAPDSVYGAEMKAKIAKAVDSADALALMIGAMEPAESAAADEPPVPPLEAAVGAAMAASPPQEEKRTEEEEERARRKREHDARLAQADAEAKERHRRAAAEEKERRRRLAEEEVRRTAAAEHAIAHREAMRRGGAPRAETGRVHHVASRAEFEARLRAGAVAVVVDWFAPWCGPCRAIAPEFERLATSQFAEALFVSVDTERAPELKALAHAHGVTAFPTFDIWLDGRKLERVVGADAAKLRAAVQSAVAAAEELCTADALALSSPLAAASETPGAAGMWLKLRRAEETRTVLVDPPTLERLRELIAANFGAGLRVIYSGKLLNGLPGATTLDALGLQALSTVVLVPGAAAAAAADGVSPPQLAQRPQPPLRVDEDDDDDDFTVKPATAALTSALRGAKPAMRAPMPRKPVFSTPVVGVSSADVLAARLVHDDEALRVLASVHGLKQAADAHLRESGTARAPLSNAALAHLASVGADDRQRVAGVLKRLLM